VDGYKNQGKDPEVIMAVLKIHSPGSHEPQKTWLWHPTMGLQKGKRPVLWSLYIKLNAMFYMVKGGTSSIQCSGRDVPLITGPVW